MKGLQIRKPKKEKNSNDKKQNKFLPKKINYLRLNIVVCDFLS